MLAAGHLSKRDDDFRRGESSARLSRRELNEFDRNLSSLGSVPGAFVGAFQALARAFMNTIGRRLRGLGKDGGQGRPSSPSKILKDTIDELAGFADGPEAQADYDSLAAVSGGTKLSAKALAAKLDLDVLTVLVNATVLAAAAEALTEIDLPTANAAAELGQALADAFDEVLEAELGEETIGSELFDAALGLKVQVLEYLAEVGGSLPAVGTYQVPSAVEVPLILVAFWRAGPGPALLTELDQLLAANPNLEDPLEVEPGAQLQVVSP